MPDSVPQPARLVRHPAAGAVVGRDDVERALGQRPPQRVAMLPRPQRRRAHELRRQLGIEVELVAQQQVVQQRLAEGGLAGVACASQLGQRVGGGEVEQQQPAARQPGQRQRPVGGLALHHGRADGRVPARIGAAQLLELARQLRHDGAVLGVDDGHAVVLRDPLHGPEDDVVGQLVGLVGHEHLDRGNALGHHRRDLVDPRQRRLAQVQVQPVVDRAVAVGLGPPLRKPSISGVPGSTWAWSMMVVTPPKAAAVPPVSNVSS